MEIMQLVQLDQLFCDKRFEPNQGCKSKSAHTHTHAHSVYILYVYMRIYVYTFLYACMSACTCRCTYLCVYMQVDCQELLLGANFEVSPALESKLHEYVMLLEEAPPGTEV